MAQQQRARKYDDKLQCYDFMLPINAPSWAYNKQPDMIYDIKYSKKTTGDVDNNDFEEEELSVVVDSMNIRGNDRSFMQK